jgi:hypothetical protein
MKRTTRLFGFTKTVNGLMDHPVTETHGKEIGDHEF